MNVVLVLELASVYRKDVAADTGAEKSSYSSDVARFGVSVPKISRSKGPFTYCCTDVVHWISFPEFLLDRRKAKLGEYEGRDESLEMRLQKCPCGLRLDTDKVFHCETRGKDTRVEAYHSVKKVKI